MRDFWALFKNPYMKNNIREYLKTPLKSRTERTPPLELGQPPGELDMYDLYETLHEDNVQWRESAKGNFVLIHNDALLATVFTRCDDCAWCIIVNKSGHGFLVLNEGYDDPEEAQERTLEILNGAVCELQFLQPKGP